MANKLGKMSISIEADHALDRMISATNDGFSGGRVTKMEIATFALLYFEEYCFKKSIERIQKTYFDDVAYLNGVVQQMRKARKLGEPSPDVKSLLTTLTSESKRTSTRRTKKRVVAPAIAEKNLDSV